MKKVLSLVLVIAMVLSSMSFAFASTFEDVADTDYAKAIETLTAIGVVTGYEDGTYRPEKVVTRAEMAKLMVEILGYGDLVAGSKSNFTDTQNHWADPWIALAAGRNIVIGDGNGNFRPDATVSYNEAITMVVRALGYTDDSNEMNSMTWPTNFKVKAAELDLLDDVEMLATGADRGGVAQLLFNALNEVFVKVNAEKDIVETTDELLSRLATLDEDYKVDSDTLDPDSKYYGGNIVDLAPYMFQSLDAYVIDDEVVYVKGTNSIVVQGTVDKVVDAVTDTINVKDSNGKIHEVPFQVVSMFYNGAEMSDNITLAELVKDGAFDAKNFETITLVGKETDLIGNDNGKLDVATELVGIVAIEQTAAARIEDVYVEDDDDLDIFDLPTDGGDVDLANITVTGDAESLEDIEVDDIVVEYLSEDDTVTKLVVTRDNTVEGKITRVDSGTKYYVDGTKYEENSVITPLALEVGDEGTFFLDHNGDVVDFEGISVGPTNYAVIVDAEDGKAVDKFNYSIETYPQIQLATQDNELVIYDVYVDLDSTGNVDDVAFIDTETKPLVTATPASPNYSLSIANLAMTLTEYDNVIVKYSLNKDGQIDELKTVEFVPLTSSKDVDDLKFTDDVLVFDANATEDYAVVDFERLEATLSAGTQLVYNKNGLIEVVVTSDVKAGTAKAAAFVNSFSPALNGNDEVQIATVYMDGEKIDAYTDTKSEFVTASKGVVFALDLDGEVITGKYKLEGTATTASAVSASSGMIKLANTVVYDNLDDVTADVTYTAGTWLTLADNATVLKLKVSDTGVYTHNAVKYSVDRLVDLKNIDVATSDLVVYMNSVGEVAFIVVLP